MSIRRSRMPLWVLVSVFSWVLATFGLPVEAADNVVYNKYNIHVSDQVDRSGAHVYKASYANYTDPGSGHLVLPMNTALRVKETRSGFSFDLEQDGKTILFEFSDDRMGMDRSSYLELITSPAPVPTDRFSDLDRQGIRDGKALAGMTREGVLAALGYPARHRTPSLEELTWVYWTNRFKTIEVVFDDAGLVKEIRR